LCLRARGRTSSAAPGVGSSVGSSQLSPCAMRSCAAVGHTFCLRQGVRACDARVHPNAPAGCAPRWTCSPPRAAAPACAPPGRHSPAAAARRTRPGSARRTRPAAFPRQQRTHVTTLKAAAAATHRVHVHVRAHACACRRRRCVAARALSSQRPATRLASSPCGRVVERVRMPLRSSAGGGAPLPPSCALAAVWQPAARARRGRRRGASSSRVWNCCHVSDRAQGNMRMCSSEEAGFHGTEHLGATRTP
jgi:hypothetical protein